MMGLMRLFRSAPPPAPRSYALPPWLAETVPARPAPESPPEPPPAPDIEPAAPRRAAVLPPEVVVLDGVYHLRFDADRILPLEQNGLPLRFLGEGWHFHALYTGFLPVLLFELRHDVGARATWFFDCTPKFLGHSVDGIDTLNRKIVVQKARLFLDLLMAAVIGAGPGPNEADAAAFFGISEIARVQFEEACRDGPAAEPAFVLACELPETFYVLPKGTGHPPVLISRPVLTAVLSQDFQSRLIKGLIDGYLSWPSLIDGSDQPSSGAIVFDLFSFAYRMDDPASGLVYFVLASEHNARFLGIYLPSEGLVVTGDEWSRQCLKPTFPNLHGRMRHYVWKFGDTLLPYLRRGGMKKLAGSMRESHIGHQLWNEFSGLEAVLAATPGDLRPALLPFGGPAHGSFGALETIFPEFAGKVHNELSTEREIVEFAYRNDLALARFTRLFVSKAMRSRIVGHMRGTDAFQRTMAQRQHVPGRLILIGLRVENRTVVDLAEFLQRLVGHIARIAPGATIVLDGQNRRDDHTPVGSFLDSLAARSPLDVELEICEQVTRGAIGKPLTIITTTGQTIASSIAWTIEAQCFIAIWGAGLAKYRWIANKPGLILSSQYHLLNPLEMSIYHEPRNMEDPTPLTYASPACVQDEPDAVQLIPVEGPRHVSFRVHDALFFAEVEAFLAESFS